MKIENLIKILECNIRDCKKTGDAPDDISWLHQPKHT